MNVTVLTVTYNRAHELQRLFASLQAQNDQDFQWLIVDDGSKDDTQAVAEAFKAENPHFELDYHLQKNGGKFRGMNAATQWISGEVTIIVDSDDTLVADGVARVKAAWEALGDYQRYGTVVFEQADAAGDLLGHFPQKAYRGSELDYRVKQRIGGDFAETVLTQALKQFPFPDYPGERFFPEGWLWNQIARHYLTADYQGVLVVGGYQAGGLSDQGRANRLKAPRAMVTYYADMVAAVFPLQTRLKAALAALTYQHFVAKDERQRKVLSLGWRLMLGLPAAILAWRWRRHNT
ncbi:glycosyltransferase family 2 protein [Eupransor demetentiae]|uniref:Catalytic subunit of cellulose synthase and poly-beta-1 n=1 Tax=Eupransor demetentiae TaxID=3109584 RepID=A0ABM9N4J3_9LACO|nr:6-N-acetylglucosamine synthase (BcsA) [Lactobacillaceae bacterium LMG 33000]